ncbi:MAG: class I SAM-dependent methyltransferase [Desulfobacterales bacterium]
MVTADLDSLGIRPGCRVLDAGCGTGRHVGALHRFPGVSVFGLDPDLRDLHQTRERMHHLGEWTRHPENRWNVLSGDVRTLPFPDGVFDLVICSEVLEHIDRDEKAAAEIVRVLKPGGDLVVSVPRFTPERICWALSTAYHLAEGGHVRIYRHSQVIRLIQRHGKMQLRRFHFAHGLHSPFWWLKCLVGPERTDVRLVNLYHRFLTWDLMRNPRLTRWLERLINPLIGKSTVFYFRKEGGGLERRER